MARLTVDDCLAIEPADLMAKDWWTRHTWRGEISWALGLTGETVSSIGFEVEGDRYYQHVARLTFTVGDEHSEPIIQEVHLDFSRPGFGGQRWYFRCPVSLADGPCNRRVGKLYLPPNGVLFACRECHELTYQSCQAQRRPRSDAALHRHAERLIRNRNRSNSDAPARAATSR